MKLSAELAAFCARLGHSFAQPALLVQSVTHGSMSSPHRDDNQRLEFLGDRVLGLVMAEALLSADPLAAEGLIAPRYNALVRRETCADVAREMDLGTVLKLGRSEMQSGGRRKEALLADAMEAVIAAVYLDAGFDAARAVVLRHWARRIAQGDADARDAKTGIQIDGGNHRLHRVGQQRLFAAATGLHFRPAQFQNRAQIHLAGDIGAGFAADKSVITWRDQPFGGQRIGG